MPADTAVQDPLVLAAGAASPTMPGWTVVPSVDRWTSYRPPGGAVTPAAGTKIHVSASLAGAAAVLRAVLPILTAANVPFKHAATLEDLAALAAGRLGVAQVGKFLTIYPGDHGDAVRLAHVLDGATAGLSGPRIRYEEPLRPGSLVHLRHGAFQSRWLQLPSGRLVPAVQGESGLEPDDRTQAGGRSAARMVGDGYVRVHRLHESPKGSSWVGFGLDRDQEELLVIKEARAFVLESDDGADARTRLHNEQDVLRTLADCPFTPDVVDAWDETDASYLAYRIVDGPTLMQLVASIRDSGQRLPAGVVRTWTRELCTTVTAVDRRGIVIADVKPANLIRTSEGFHVIDLELAGPPTTSRLPGIGTPGYVSPQQASPDHGRQYRDDVYAVAATVFTMITLVDAGSVPDLLAAARLELSQSGGGAAWAAVVRGLDPDPARRFATVAELADAVERGSAAVAGGPAGDGDVAVPTGSRWDGDALATEVGDRLLASAVTVHDGLLWRSDHPIVGGAEARDLYAGTAGVALFLAELGVSTGQPRFLDAARAAGRWLAQEPPAYAARRPMPGLYFGEAGHGMLHLKLFAATQDEFWLDQALSVGRRVSVAPSHSPDLLTGDAGVALYLVALHAAAGDPRDLDAAGRVLRRLATAVDRRTPVWTIPDDHEGLSGQTYLGLSHGSAGAGLAFAHYAAASGDESARRWTADITEYLIAQAVPCPRDGDGLAWRIAADAASPVATYWCHGSAGIAHFFTAAFRLLGTPELTAVLGRTAAGVAAESDWIGTTLCHGLAGNADSLVEIWQATGDRGALDSMTEVRERLLVYATDQGWPAESRDRCPPDLMVGEAGVGAALLRMADPRRPHLLNVTARPVGPTPVRRQESSA